MEPSAPIRVSGHRAAAGRKVATGARDREPCAVGESFQVIAVDIVADHAVDSRGPIGRGVARNDDGAVDGTSTDDIECRMGSCRSDPDRTRRKQISYGGSTQIDG